MTLYNHTVRIIAGELKGREISPPRGSKIRPATGLVRETVMNLFTVARLQAGPFLDLCAGSGLVGLEALSRGAPRVVFVETDSRSAGHLKKTLHAWDLLERATVLKLDARRCFKTVDKILDGQPVACAFLDPPFISGMAGDLLEHFGRQAKILSADGRLIIRAVERLSDNVTGLAQLSQRELNRAWLAEYTYQSDAQEGNDADQ